MFANYLTKLNYLLSQDRGLLSDEGSNLGPQT